MIENNAGEREQINEEDEKANEVYFCACLEFHIWCASRQKQSKIAL